MRRTALVSGLLLMLALMVAAVNIAPQAGAQGSLGIRRYLPLLQGSNAAPTPSPSPNPLPLPLPPADDATANITMQPGFAIRTYASNLSGPRLMAIGPNGQLYVAERGGRVTRLADANRDGKADQNITVAQGLSEPNSVEWYNGSLYVAENNAITKLTDGNNDGDFLDSGEETTITTALPAPEGHRSRTLHFGPDGKLYVAAGSKCNIPRDGCTEDDPRRAAILRFNIDGTIPGDNPFANSSDERRRSIWAEGLRNSVDFLWAPNGQLWASSQGSDGLGDNTPPEEIVINVEKGKHYGWPYCYTPQEGRVTAKEVRDERVPLPAGFTCEQNATPAVFTDKAHSAPIGMELGRGPHFPAAFRDDVYVAYHGSWNTNDPANYRDCKVQRIEVENGQPVRSSEFATVKRATNQKCGDAWGRPADVVFGTDGAMYISDDKNGRIYRVVYTGQ